MEKSRTQHPALGAAAMTAKSVCTALSALLVKWASHAFSTEFLAFVRFACGFVVFAIILKATGRLKGLRPQRPWLLAAASACLVAMTYSYFLSLRWISLMDAALFLNAASLYAPVIGVLFLGRKEPREVWAGLVIGLVGVAAVLHPDQGMFDLNSFFGFLSGLFLAIFLAMQQTLAREEPVDRITLNSHLFCAAICMAPLLFTGLPRPGWEAHLFPPRVLFDPFLVYPWTVASVVALGLLSVLPLYLSTYSVNVATMGQVGPFRYAGVVFAAFLDWIFYGMVPDMASVAGFVLITAGGVIVLMGAARRGKKGL